MGAVFVHMNAGGFFCIYIAAHMGTPVHYQHFLSFFSCFICKYGAEQSGAYYQIII